MSKYLRVSRNYRYTAWLGMVRRCTKPEHPAWRWYGGRGISVCRQWLDSFGQFVDDMGERPSRGHSLDRIDNSKGYSPDNCRWATRKQQTRNRRKAAPRKNIIRVDGLSLTELALASGICRATIKRRYRAGKRGKDLVASDLRNGSYWRGQKRNPDGTMVRGAVVPR